MRQIRDVEYRASSPSLASPREASLVVRTDRIVVSVHWPVLAGRSERGTQALAGALRRVSGRRFPCLPMMQRVGLPDGSKKESPGPIRACFLHEHERNRQNLRARNEMSCAAKDWCREPRWRGYPPQETDRRIPWL
jgi:hypothetical protein